MAAQPAFQPVANRGLITISIMLATIMQALDTTIANVALPHIQGSLSAASDQITWVLTSYIVAAAIMTPLTGYLAGRMGIKRVFLFSVAGFTVASALCGLAGSLAEIVLFRLLQGICGAALVPLSQSVLLNVNPPEKHGQAMAVWGAGIMVGPILGPALGGWLTDNYDWRWVFFINIPVGIIAFAGIATFIKERRNELQTKFDLFGFATLALGVGALQLMLDRGELLDWFGSTEIWIEAALAGLAFWWFIVHTATAKNSFLNTALLKDRNFATGCVFIFFVGIILYSTLALLPPMMQELMNYPVVTTGIATAPRGVGTMISMILVGRIVGKVDTRLIILTGLLLTAYSLWQMTGFSLQMGMRTIIVSGIFQGLGLGLVFVPLSTITFATLTPALRTEGTAIFSLLRNIGSSIGISMVSALLTSNTQILHSSMVQHIRPDNPMFQAGSLPAPYSLTEPHGLAALDGMVTRQASMIAYIDDFWLVMVIALAAIPLLFLMRGPKRTAGPAPATHMALD